MNEKTEYTCCFLFSQTRRNVLLLRKRTPEWQCGYLNGIGGKIEACESPLRCMIRELKEETGEEFNFDALKHFCTHYFEQATVHFFSLLVPHRQLLELDYRKNDVSEQFCYIYDWENKIYSLNVIPNLKWLLPLSSDDEVLEPVKVNQRYE